MKRIARLGAEQFRVADAPAGHAELTEILKRHLPPSTVALFARPKPLEGDVIEWYSDLGGQPVPFDQLPSGEAAQVKRLLDERLASIQQLATKLEAQGADGEQQAALLRQAARYPDTSTLYSLNGQPVLTFWGYGLKGAEPIAGANHLAGAAAASAAGADSSSSSPPSPPPVEPQSRRRWWPWLLLLTLLLLLAALLWWLFCREEEPTTAEPPAAIEQPQQVQPEPPKPEELKPEEPTPEEPTPEEPKPEEPKPEEPPPPPPPPPPDPLDELAKQVGDTKDCAALQKMQKEKLLQGSEPKAVALKKQITETIKRDCKKELIKEAKNQCPGERPKELAPELIIVFDASGSMDYSLNASREDIAQAEQMVANLSNAGAIGQLFGALAGAEAQTQLTREPKRITTAKQATASVVQQIPSDVNIGLVMVECCPGDTGCSAGAPNSGYFAPAQRGNLLSYIQAIRPVQGTPLANGVAQAGKMLDGVNKESVMLVVSDGEESCNGDPCAVAQQLARSKPYLKINVVDIMGTGAGNCLAEATGGRVFTARNVSELAAMTRQAAKDVLGPGDCR